MKKIEKKRNTEENPLDLREKGRETAQFLILSANTIRLSADILITLENSLIVFSISQGENKICSIENKIPPIEIEKPLVLVMAENTIFSITDLRARF